MTIFSYQVAHRFAKTVLLASAIAICAATAGHAQQAANPPPAEKLAVAADAVTAEDQARATLRSETRIRKLHDRLRITADEETQWNAVAQVMRDNDTAFRTNLNDATSEMKNATAVTDLKTFQIIADRHSSGLRAFIPAFEKLYAVMPAAQQKRVDGVFGEHHRFFRL